MPFLGLVLLLGAAHARAQSSNDPSDATAALVQSGNAGTSITICTLGTSTTGMSLNGSTSTTSVPVPPCGNFTASTNDVWFRLEIPASPTTADYRYRITLSPGAIAPSLTNGALAAYSAVSASGPFNLLGCASGGNPTAGQFDMPSLEFSCLAAGTKIYLRVWDEATPASTASFDICVQRQRFDTTPIGGVYDSPCSAFDMGTPVTACTTSPSTYIVGRNTFACTEAFPWDPSCAGYQGGDVWFRTTVPANGGVTINLLGSSTASERITRLGMTAYSATNCSNWSMFNEVGCSTPTVSSTTPSPLTIRCLTPGSTLYIRVYATSAAQVTPPRYGGFRICISEVASATPPTAVNNAPCDATPLVFGNCLSTETNLGGCFTSGVPAPGCGTITSSSSNVWYSFTAGPNGMAGVTVNGLFGFDPAFAVYTSGNAPCNGPLTLVTCDDRHGPGNDAYSVLSGLIPGQVYYVRVWGEATSGTQVGYFDICLSDPAPAPGFCMYLLVMTAPSFYTGSAQMAVSINGGTPVLYNTTGNENSQTFLIPVPTGSNVVMTYNSVNGTTERYSIYQFGSNIPLIERVPGGAVVGPTPSPGYSHTFDPACGPLSAAPQDCLGAITLCNSGTTFSTTASYTGDVVDLTAANRGCLSSESRGGRWYYFRPQVNGIVRFEVVDTDPGDFDFAVWDGGLTAPPATCPPPGPPIRCSSAPLDGSTGLRVGSLENSEGSTGDKWVAPLTVASGHVYILYITNIHASNRQFALNWTQLTDLSGTPVPNLLDCAVLPVELLYLKADSRGTEIDVTWATASEKNSSHFIIERSKDAIDFSPIGEMPAAGDSQQRVDYGFTDASPLAGMNYYRLEQVDRDGTSVNTYVVVAMAGADVGTPMVYPNPVKDRLLATFSALATGQVEVQVIDAMGRAVKRLPMTVERGRRVAEIDAQDLVPGAYLIHIISAAGELIGNTRFIKE